MLFIYILSVKKTYNFIR